MGARFHGQCFKDASTAAAAECASTAGVTAGGALRCESVGGEPGAPLLNLTLTAGQGDPQAFTVATTYQACDPFEGYADLLGMWAPALLALTALWCIKHFILKFVMPQ